MPIRPERKALYPADWKAISLKVRNAAGWRCEWCPAEQGKPAPISGKPVVLTVAHLNHDETDCADANLRALCQRCHLAYDAPERKRRRMARLDG
jgi:hypothetical protein